MPKTSEEMMALPIDFLSHVPARCRGNGVQAVSKRRCRPDVPVSIRINEKKGAPAPSTTGAPCERVAWRGNRLLPARKAFSSTVDPLFHAGAYLRTGSVVRHVLSKQAIRESCADALSDVSTYVQLRVVNQLYLAAKACRKEPAGQQ
ncbi:MAG: hypothetical protein ACLRS8_05775 [Parabacteroides merdae]